jgi:hypothetical protein
MPYKDKQKQKEYQQQHYQKHKQTYRSHLQKRRKAGKAFLISLKKSKQCIVCGENDIECLDFHHLGNKDLDLSQAVRDGWSQERMLSEVQKCVVMCANCHLKLHPRHQDTATGELAGTTKRFRRNREWLDKYKQSCECEDCGENNPACLVFHHIGEKKTDISRMIGKGYAIESIIEELKQCMCLCGKCHRKRHKGNHWEGDSKMKSHKDLSSNG